MNRLQVTCIVLALSCIDSKVLGGLLPGSNTGYQYNRPDGEGFVGGLNTGGIEGRTVRGYSGKTGGARPSPLYGVAGFGAGRGFRGGFNGDDFLGGNANEYQNGGGYQGRGYYNEDNDGPRPYDFRYEVRDQPSGNNYAQVESSDGNSVRGEYRVYLPDSRTQIVKYTADNVHGYNADVQYEGQAQFPQGFDAGGYQSGGSGFNGRGGPGIFGSGTGGGNNNQYLPPSGGYGK